MFGDYQPNRFGPSRSPIICKNGAVATSQPLAAQAGLKILQEGGNAVDSAVATAAVLNVVEPMSTGIGGDAFALVYMQTEKKLVGLNASGRSAYAADPELLRHQGLTTIPAYHDLRACNVPGAFDGWTQLIERYGSMSMSEVLQPAIDYAENGFPVSPQIGKSWSKSVRMLSYCENARQTYLINGRSPKIGEVFQIKPLARTLQLLAEGGRRAFYEGEIAQQIVQYSNRNNGWLSMKDFQDHTSEWVEPICTNYGGYQVYELPPNGQGIAALIALNIMRQFEQDQVPFDSPDRFHLMIEAMKLGLVDLHQHVTDPTFSDIPVSQLLSLSYAKEQAKRINMRYSLPSVDLTQSTIGYDTVYLSVVDGNRNVVSFINSLFHQFGSYLVAGNTGILLQNRGAGFSLDCDHVNYLAPHKRTLHTIIPGMMMKDGMPVMPFGVMGGPMQPQGHLQLISNLVDYNMDIQSALDAPRFQVMLDGKIAVEDSFRLEVLKALESKNHQLLLGSDTFFGGGQAILVDPENDTLVAGSDPRRDGCAVGY